MFARIKRHDPGHNRTRGAALVEMAMMLPFLLLFLVGVMELGVMLYDKAVLTNASREGARLLISAAGDPITDTQVTNRVNTFLQNHMISFSPSSVSTTVTRAGSATGDEVRVRVSYQYTFLVLPNFVSITGNTLTMGAETSMRLE